MKLYKVFHVLGDNYLNHQIIREIFPGEQKLLWKERGNHLLVLATDRIDPRADGDERIQFMSSLHNKIAEVKDTDFSIRINSAKRTNGKRVCIPSDELEEWTSKKLSGLGFKLREFQIANEGKIVSLRRGVPNTHASVFVSGILTVDDRDVFIETMKSGIGHAKAYGFGLLDIFQHM